MKTNQSKVHLLDLLRRRGLNFDLWVDETGVKDWDDMLGWCRRMGVVPPPSDMWVAVEARRTEAALKLVAADASKQRTEEASAAVPEVTLPLAKKQRGRKQQQEKDGTTEILQTEAEDVQRSDASEQ